MEIKKVKIKNIGFIINNNEGSFIPNDPSNSDYKAIIEWVKNGGIIEPEFTDEELFEKAKEAKIHKIEEIYLQENLRPHFFDGLVLRGPGTGTIKKFKFSLDFVNQKIPALEPDRYLKTSCITQRPLAYATVDEKNNKIVVRIKPNEALSILNHVITRFENNFTIYSIILTDIENCKKIEDLDKIFWDPKLATFEMMVRMTKLMNS
jgi:hypothetical protein